MIFRRRGFGQTSPSTLAAAIARQEGYGVPGVPATVNNNPGNLTSPPGGTWAGQTGVSSQGFAIFDNVSDGWAALNTDIASNAGLTLSQFLTKYAPPSQNNTTAYISNVSSWTGASPNDTVADIVAGNTAPALVAGNTTPAPVAASIPDFSSSDGSADTSSVSSDVTIGGFDVSAWWQGIADSMGIDPTTLGIGAAVVAFGLIYFAASESA